MSSDRRPGRDRVLGTVTAVLAALLESPTVRPVRLVGPGSRPVPGRLPAALNHATLEVRAVPAGQRAFSGTVR